MTASKHNLKGRFIGRVAFKVFEERGCGLATPGVYLYGRLPDVDSPFERRAEDKEPARVVVQGLDQEAAGGAGVFVSGRRYEADFVG